MSSVLSWRKHAWRLVVPEGLTLEQRRTLYRMMRLTVLATSDSELIAEWGCNESTTPQCSAVVTTIAFRFRTLLGREAVVVELMPA